MNTKQDDGGPAFPRPASEYTPNDAAFDIRVAAVPYTGMTLRDYFAAAALQGILAQPLESDCAFSPELCAGSAYEYADAMLAARKEGA
jgi:hypothetical protein